MNAISLDIFRDEIHRFVDSDSKPRDWRRGQAVFNFIEHEYGVAREVQFIDGVDCFYNDDVIEQFILLAYRRVASTFNHQ